MSSRDDTSAAVRRAREQFLSAGRLDDATPRPDVLDSWRRSSALGVHPDRFDLPFVRDPDCDSPLSVAATPVLRRVADDLTAHAVSVILTSADGLVLQRLASEPSINKALDTVRLAPGYSYAEEFVGTNGIGTALETGRPTFIRGDEHYVGTLGGLACAGSPIRDPVTGKLIGVLDLTCWARQSDPLLFALAKSASGQIEDRLSALARKSETALLEAFREHARLFPLGVLAIGADVVLMNRHLRETLEANDQIALVEHASDLLPSRVARPALAVLPSGKTVKITAVERAASRGGTAHAVFHVHLAADATAHQLGTGQPWQRLVETGQDALGVLAELQASLRRVATLVAQGVDPSEVFSTVAGELARCLDVYHSALVRYEPDGTAALVAGRHVPGLTKMPVGLRFSPANETVATRVFRTGRAARMDAHDNAPGPAVAHIVTVGICSAVGAPIIVDGRLWGAAIVGSTRPEPLPPDTEARVRDFADLVATAIANAETRAQLTASRARLVTAADDARRRVERDLHDGAQQRLVSLGLELRAAEAQVPPELHPLKEQISHIATGLAGISEELHEISRGLQPAILSKGLGPALNTLARRSAVPVQLALGVGRPVPESAEVAAYYVIAEALTNAAKHARASNVDVRVDTEGAQLRILVRDDGIGGADARKGSGLTGLLDRVEANGGQMRISSPAGRGTSLHVTIPIGSGLDNDDG
ncbi:GAF domain-containing protein [Mycobacterium sp.]|uniref:GAF domain-containing protein n=1 Tax=Mycobacterium sp. TaxID=1785 RepID=UPI002D6F2CC0|nr:GAF domain-containing protein [Mycobacterium sp.]HZA11168.1 GAF domain-containing protein [Mycobacterium sp.]